MDVTRDNERKLNLEQAFKEYRERENLRKENKKVAKLVTDGFDEDDARKH